MTRVGKLLIGLVLAMAATPSLTEAPIYLKCMGIQSPNGDPTAAVRSRMTLRISQTEWARWNDDMGAFEPLLCRNNCVIRFDPATLSILSEGQVYEISRKTGHMFIRKNYNSKILFEAHCSPTPPPAERPNQF